MQKRVLVLGMAVAVAAVTGCSQSNKGDGGKGDSASSASADAEKSLFASPIELTVFQKYANITDQEFDDYFVKGVQAKYPNVKMNLIHDGKGHALKDLVTAGTIPDIVFINNDLQYVNELGLAADLTPYIKKYNVDLNAYNKVAVDAIKMNSDSGKLFALPFSLNWYALFYNKDVFDKFGIAYPKDLMSWDDTIELAKRLTRKEDNTQYYGLDPVDPVYWANGLSLPNVDPKTGKAMLDTPQRNMVYQKMKLLYDIPGELPPEAQYNTLRTSFLNDHNVAMSAYFGIGTVNTLEQMQQSGKGLNWDMVTSPNFKEAIGTSQAVNLHNLMVTSQSKYPEQAFLVVKELVSKTIQMQAVRNARMSPLVDPALQKEFGANLDTMKGKNIQGIFKANPAPLPPYSKNTTYVETAYRDAFKDVLYNGKDINSGLRDAENVANKNIEDAGGQ